MQAPNRGRGVRDQRNKLSCVVSRPRISIDFRGRLTHLVGFDISSGPIDRGRNQHFTDPSPQQALKWVALKLYFHFFLPMSNAPRPEPRETRVGLQTGPA